MSDLDKLIEEALGTEDAELLTRYGGERGFFAEALSAFQGPTAWVIWLIYIVQIVMFGIGVYFTWHLFQTADLMIGLRYGLGALLMFLMGAILKTGMGMRIETNRIIREVKRLELQVARERTRRPE